MPPPRFDNVPWYEAVESNQPLEIAKLSLLPNRPGQQVLIHGDSWLVLRLVAPRCVILTYPGWQGIGFEWRLECKSVDSADSAYGIILDGRKAHTEREVIELLDALCEERIRVGNAPGVSRELMRKGLLRELLRRSVLDTGYEFINGRVHVRRWQIVRSAPALLDDAIYWRSA